MVLGARALSAGGPSSLGLSGCGCFDHFIQTANYEKACNNENDEEGNRSSNDSIKLSFGDTTA
jgi:hypothetical protein